MLGGGDNRRFEDTFMTADTITVTDGKATHVLGVVSVEKQIVFEQVTHQYVMKIRLRLNGTTLRTLVFNSNSEHRIGRLISESWAEIGPLKTKEYPKK